MPAKISRCILSLTLFMFLSALVANVTPVADLEGIAAQSTTLVSAHERKGMLLAGTPHAPIAIDGDANFSASALLEGWPGDGSPESPYIIDGLDIELGGEFGHCIYISNTQVHFTISNCNLTSARDGIQLENVTNGELVNNTCNNNWIGICLNNSDWNTVIKNTCDSNGIGIYLYFSNNNTVSDNTCNDNEVGIRLDRSIYNTVTENTCNSNVRGEFDWTGNGIYLDYSDNNTVVGNTCLGNIEYGIHLYLSDYNTVMNNTCNNNWIGICLNNSHWNIVSNNICNNNRIGIYLDSSDCNTVTHNTYLSNTEHDIYLDRSLFNTVENNIITISEKLVYFVLLLVGFAGITLLGTGWRKVSARGVKDYIIAPTSYRIASWFSKKRSRKQGGRDDIIVPTGYRVASWFRERRALKHEIVDEPLEPDQSDR